MSIFFFFFFQAEDGIRDHCVTGVQTCALPIYGRQGDGDTLVANRHRVREYDAPVGHDVLVDRLVAYRSTTLEAEARELTTTNSEVQGELLYLPALALGKPTTFGCLVREGREHARGRYRVRSLDAEGAVDDGALGCGCVHQVMSLFLGGRPVVWSSSTSMSPKGSSRRSHCDWRSAIHSAATLSPVGSIRQVRTRPIFCVRMTPLRSSTWRC